MKKFLYSLGSTCLMFFLILFSVFTVVNTKSFYIEQYEKNGAEISTGMSMENLEKATVMLLDYLNGDRDNLDMQAEEFGTMAETFDEREKAHMSDVKALYQNFRQIMYILLVAFCLIFDILFIKDRKNFLAGAEKGGRFAACFAAVLCVIFALVFTVGFDSFWTMFHKVMFSNDLWLLDPEISTMINMFPLNFWFAVCSNILIRFAVLFLAFFVCIKAAKQYKYKKDKETNHAKVNR